MAEVSEAITHMMCNSTIAVLLQQIGSPIGSPKFYAIRTIHEFDANYPGSIVEVRLRSTPRRHPPGGLLPEGILHPAHGLRQFDYYLLLWHGSVVYVVQAMKLGLHSTSQCLGL